MQPLFPLHELPHYPKDTLTAFGHLFDKMIIANGDYNAEAGEAELQNNRAQMISYGAGLRVCNSNFILFEKTINAIHEHAPNAKIMFNTNPTDTAESVQRWI